MDKPTMDYAKAAEEVRNEPVKDAMDYATAAEEVRNGPADLPQVTRVLADLLEDLNANKVQDVTAEPEADDAATYGPDNSVIIGPAD